jgi:ribosome biogenesis GTPase / thiamine phosphate phosphatase
MSAETSTPVALETYGWNANWRQQMQSATAALALAESSPESEQPTFSAARVISAHRGAFQIISEQGVCWAELPGRLYHQATDRLQLPVVGDWVLVQRLNEACADDGAAVLRSILPRASFLVRKAAGKATVPQPIVANVDVGFVVTSLNADLSLPRIDRYLAMLSDSHIPAVIVLSKTDLVTADNIETSILRLREVGILEAIAVSAQSGYGMDVLRQRVGSTQTAILLGSSGVGKSTIVNAILGREQQSTGAIRQDQRGTHTTTKRELVLTDQGMWIDTPGMRELGRWHANEEEEETVFDDIQTLSTKCRFADCKHDGEPGCAVADAIRDGALTAERLANFRKLQTERAAQLQGQRTARQRKEHLQKLGVALTSRQNRRR